jgi:hypothetical protein
MARRTSTHISRSVATKYNTGMLKKAASGVLAIVPCSRTESTLRAPK